MKPFQDINYKASKTEISIKQFYLTLATQVKVVCSSVNVPYFPPLICSRTCQSVSHFHYAQVKVERKIECLFIQLDPEKMYRLKG